MHNNRTQSWTHWARLAAMLSLLGSAAAASESAPRPEVYHPEVITLPANQPPQVGRAETAEDCELAPYSLAPQFFVKRVSRERQACGSASSSDMVANNHSVLTLEQPESQ